MYETLKVTNGEIEVKLDLDRSGHCCGIGKMSGLDMGNVKTVNSGGWPTEEVVELVEEDKELIFNTIRKKIKGYMEDAGYGIMSFSDALGEDWDGFRDSRKRTVGFSLADFAKELGIKPDCTLKSPATGNRIALYHLTRSDLRKKITIKLPKGRTSIKKIEEKAEVKKATTAPSLRPILDSQRVEGEVWASRGCMSLEQYLLLVDYHHS